MLRVTLLRLEVASFFGLKNEAAEFIGSMDSEEAQD